MKVSPYLVLFGLAVLLGVEAKVCLAQDEQSVEVRKVVSRIAPVYPQVARTMKLSGTVKLEVVVESNGGVKTVLVKGGNPLLAQSAQSAVRGWKWEKASRETTEHVECTFTP
jgi:TonB family protein